jgi:predicted permease
MLKDIRFAFRMLVKNPGFTLVAVLSLAIGTGANSAMFSLADALLLRPLPVARPGEVLTVASRTPKDPFGQTSYRDYADLRDNSHTVQGMVATTLLGVGFTASKDALPQVKYGLLASGNLFQVMGVKPFLGRAFRPDEDQVPGRDAVVVLGYSFWKEQMAADPNVVGHTVRLNGIDFTVIGVAPEEFTGMDQYFKAAMFVPIMMYPRLTDDLKNEFLEKRDRRGLTVKARLKPGVTQAAAEGELISIAKGLEQSFPDTNKDQSVALRTELQFRIERSPPDAALVAMLLTLAISVLVVACLNVANLLLSRARSRSREVAVRLAMGAGRTRLVRQLLTESLLLALAGAAGGLVFGYVGIVFFRGIQMPSDLPFTFNIALDQRALAISLATAVLSVLVFGLAPALQSSRTDLVPALKSGDADSAGKRRLWGRNLLVVGQVAISLVLLVVATMLYRGFDRLLTGGVGYRTDHLMMMSFDPKLVRYTDAQSQDFFRRLVERAASAPGAKSAALSSVVPMAPNQSATNVYPEGHEVPKGQRALFLLYGVVDEHYFDTMNISLVRGRAFRATDNASAPKVAVINEVIANKYWPGKDPVGKRFHMKDDSGPWIEVVGVAKTAKYLWIAESPIQFLYVPLAQSPAQAMTLLVQSSGDSAAMAAPLREVVRGLDSNMPIFDVRTMENFYQMRAVNTPKMILNTVGTMGTMGVILAMVGLYGLVAYSVSRRTREFGIRMAIGANSGSVLRIVLRQGMVLSLTGIGIGLGLSFLAAQGVGQVFYATGYDWTAFMIAPLGLIAVTLLSAYGPALRASRIDPMRALRYE